MIRSYITGNIVELFMKHGANIAHGCNCFCLMGAGVAKQLADAYSPIKNIDKETLSGDYSKLGTYTVSTHSNMYSKCYNLYTQYEPGANVDYGAIFNAFKELNDIMPVSAMLYIPKIGAGIAGGDWELIEKLINLATPDLDIIVVEWNGND